MQGQLDLSNLTKMSGIEYGLIHYQDPILYIIQVWLFDILPFSKYIVQKRERRQNPGGGSSVTPLGTFYGI